MKKTATLSMLTGFALMLSWVEALIPLAPGIPGIKLGLANLAVVLVLYLFGWKEAILVNLMRVFLSSFLFGNFYLLFYSLSGALLSFAVMVLLRRSSIFGMAGVSLAGGVFHNIGQLLVAMAVVETVQVGFYLPWLLAAGCVTGFLIGITAGEVIRHLPRSGFSGGDTA